MVYTPKEREFYCREEKIADGRQIKEKTKELEKTRTESPPSRNVPQVGRNTAASSLASLSNMLGRVKTAETPVATPSGKEPGSEPR